MGILINHTGERFGSLVVTGRAGSYGKQATWHAICDCGNERVVRGLFLRLGATQTCGDRAVHPPKRGGVPRYMNAHNMVRKVRGSAYLQDCVTCGGDATEWSYDHQDPNEILTASGHPYSLDPEHYQPRCTSCHRTFDAAYTKALEGAES